MSNNEYISNAVKNGAPISSELVARLTQKRTASVLISTLLGAARSGEQVDILKKHIFYGKAPKWDSSESGSISPSFRVRLENPRTINLLHAAMGLCTEAAEMIEAIVKHLVNDEDLDEVNLLEEAGDLFWYLALFADTVPTSFENIQIRNSAKLRARYPNKFNEAKALTRDLDKEREVLVNSFLCNTVSREKGAKIIDIDYEHGYINGYLEGPGGFEGQPIIWSLKDGSLLGGGNGKQNLDMNSFKKEGNYLGRK